MNRRQLVIWARAWAKEIVADGRPVGRYFQDEDEIRMERRIAKALREAYMKGSEATG